MDNIQAAIEAIVGVISATNWATIVAVKHRGSVECDYCNEFTHSDEDYYLVNCENADRAKTYRFCEVCVNLWIGDWIEV